MLSIYIACFCVAFIALFSRKAIRAMREILTDHE